ncbi:MAG: bifunctional 23S rRNA (guanine(2069)-N(7))-methyltransferase RlmK/23S rRNA (guanine(2445)-N(2))-methyltransferase RlmL, partial [Coriobacteriia bacterium]|nr:bifunctional 23S rRNA (guanine(2069)-N(7))-methyltransferase RlmK/23S rRNA (guanine(2445)-N(2))-methyltransferase RlmL [Coriobacteriia bacterium]
MTDRLDFFAPCPRGTEALLGDELRSLRVRGVRPLTSGVSFSGELRSAYRALLWSRIASRVLLTLARVPADSADALYEAVRALPWEDHVRADGTIAVDAGGMNDALRNTQFTAVRVKDAIADRFTERFGRRPNVDTAAPDLLVNVVLRGEKAVISIDLSGPPLHQRGYREPGVQVEAPMKENLAAAMLAVAGWRDIAKAGGAFLDPMCGSGTLAIEAAMIAGDIAPGLTRRRWGITGWLAHDAALWAQMREDAADRREAGLATLVPIAASDSDPRAIAVATNAIRRAGLEGAIALSTRELANVEAPITAEGAHAPSGLLATNPPYGERLGSRAALPALYAELGEVVRSLGDQWTLAVITPDANLGRGLSLTPVREHTLFNGKIESPVRVFSAGVQEVAETAAAEGGAEVVEQQRRGDEPSTPRPARILDASAEAFANRLRKMTRHTEKWARKAGVTCYRVYDADLPDYSVAIDVYNGSGADEGRRWIHIAEYAPPPQIDPAKALGRLDDVLAIVPEILGVDERDVFLKIRERQRGTSQYTRFARTNVTGAVDEAGLHFDVNLSDYLDTGIFLDHRITRGMVRDMASGTRFLNLFAYTGTASVYAAAGGSRQTTTVDLSATYTEWAGHNMAANGFGGTEHRLIQADVLQWLEAALRAEERFDLVFCDPPTFSNSKRMVDTWDVQRDHVHLITRICRLLAPGGTLVFSCNRRKFALDAPALEAAGLAIENVTAATIPR